MSLAGRCGIRMAIACIAASEVLSPRDRSTDFSESAVGTELNLTATTRDAATLSPYSDRTMNALWEAGVKTFGSDGPQVAWALACSFVLDILLMVFISGRSRCSCCTTRRRFDSRSASTRHQNLPDAEGVVRDLREAMDRCSEESFCESNAGADQDAPVLDISSSTTLTLPKVSKRRTASELKLWMQKQRGQCEVVENTQALVITDAKAPPDQMVGRYEEEAPPVDVAPRSQRAKRLSGSQLKAWMDKKRDECHVLESAQEHISTDAKATGSPTFGAKKVMSLPNKENLDKRRTSNRELQEWMNQKRDQCEVLGVTP